MVKGIDFDNVQLVGVVDPDTLLSFADFRVNERAFQLMEQVSGRAGRRDGKGRVMIQVMNTQHPVLEFVQQHDYKRFFTYEMEHRRRFFYPPFSRIIGLTFKHKLKDIVDDGAYRFAQALKQNFDRYMVGPAEPVVNRVRNQFLMELVFKLPKDGSVIAACKSAIQQQVAALHSEKRFKSLVIIPDVDP